MKGIGHVKGWVVDHRLTNEIVWKQTHGNREAAVWQVGLGGGKYGYEFHTANPQGKVKLFKGAGSLSRALAAAKRYMEKHPRTTSATVRPTTPAVMATGSRKRRNVQRIR